MNEQFQAQKQDLIEKTSFLQTFSRFSLRVAGARRLNKSVQRLFTCLKIKGAFFFLLLLPIRKGRTVG